MEGKKEEVADCGRDKRRESDGRQRSEQGKWKGGDGGRREEGQERGLNIYTYTYISGPRDNMLK